VYNILLQIINNIKYLYEAVVLKYHYVYRITNIKDKLYYYGTRTSSIEPKLDLGIKYFSSSKDKDFIQGQKDNPLNYKYKIIKIFNIRKEAIELEIKLHNKFDVGINESFYNRSKQTSAGWDTTGTKWEMSKIGKENIKKSILKRGGHKGENNPRYNVKLTQDTKDKISHSLKNNGYSDTEETRKKKSESAKNRKPVSQETREKISKIHKGKKVSKETILKMLKTKEGKNYGPNYNSLLVNIYDNKMNLLFECNGNFNKICAENNLPTSALRKSLKTNKPIYENLDAGNLSRIKKNGMYKYKGWIAEYRD
jgi:hypothetical protein